MLSQSHPSPGTRLIVEGIDGSGTSTELSLLHRWLMRELTFTTIDARQSIDQMRGELRSHVADDLERSRGGVAAPTPPASRKAARR